MHSSTEVDNLSPSDSKIACLGQSIEINNNKYVHVYMDDIHFGSTSEFFFFFQTPVFKTRDITSLDNNLDAMLL